MLSNNTGTDLTDAAIIVAPSAIRRCSRRSSTVTGPRSTATASVGRERIWLDAATGVPGSSRAEGKAECQPPPPVNHAARWTPEWGSPCGTTGAGFVAVPVTLVGATPMRTTTQSAPRSLAIQLAPGSAARIRSTSAMASSRFMTLRIVLDPRVSCGKRADPAAMV